MKNVILKIYLVFALVFFTFVGTGSNNITSKASDGFEFKIVNDRRVTITRYTGNAVTLNIPEQIQGLPVTVIGNFAFSRCSKLKNVNIPPTVRYIGIYAFGDCSRLTSITIPSSVISIGDLAFLKCDRLTSITVDSLNRTYASVDGVLFDKDLQLLIKYPTRKRAKTYTVPSSVMFIDDYAFSSCTSLTDITIPPSVTIIGDQTFFECSNLSSITIPPSVTSIGRMAFEGCDKLASLTLSRGTQIGREAFPDSVRIIYRD